MEKKTAKKTFESMKPDPENESPRRSWSYIFLAILIIFGLTFLFQQMNEPPSETVDPYSFDQLKDQVQEMSREIMELEQRIEELEK